MRGVVSQRDWLKSGRQQAPLKPSFLSASSWLMLSSSSLAVSAAATGLQSDSGPKESVQEVLDAQSQNAVEDEEKDAAIPEVAESVAPSAPEEVPEPDQGGSGGIAPFKLRSLKVRMRSKKLLLNANSAVSAAQCLTWWKGTPTSSGARAVIASLQPCGDTLPGLRKASLQVR